MSISSFLPIVALSALVLGAQHLYGQTESEVHFASGASSADVKGTVTGNDYVDFVLGANAGQVMEATLAIDESDGNGTAFFNILPPGSDGVSIYTGSMDGSEASVTLPDTGNYRIRVYQMGNDKDTGKTTAFTISVAIK